MYLRHHYFNANRIGSRTKVLQPLGYWTDDDDECKSQIVKLNFPFILYLGNNFVEPSSYH